MIAMPMHQGFIPREGFCFDVILELIRRTALNPSVLLQLILLARYTKQGRDLSILHPVAYGRLRKLFYFAVARVLSNYFSDKVRNNWKNDKYDWSREIVLITGGAGGIGGSMVNLFAEMNVTVVVLDVQPMPHATSPKIHHYNCDIRSPEKVAVVADQVRREVGRPTVIINNAGVARGKTLLDARPSDVRFTFDVNTLAHYWITKAFLPHMVAANHGMVVTVSSYASWLTIPNMVDYGASKAAALAFHEGLTAELRTKYNAPKVRTVVVHPGHTATELFKGYSQNTAFVMPELHADTMAEAVVQQVLSGRSGSVILPQAGYMLPLLRFMPDWYQIRLRNRGQSFMSGWRGRQVISDVDASYENHDQSEPNESAVLMPRDDRSEVGESEDLMETL